MKFRPFLMGILCAALIAGSAGEAFAFIKAAQRRKQQQVQQARQQQARQQAAPRRRVVQQARPPQQNRPAAKPRETLEQHLAKVRRGSSLAKPGASPIRYQTPRPAEPVYQSRVLKSKDSSGSAGPSSSSVLVR